MKRMSALLLTLLLEFSLTACGGTPAQDTPDAGTDTSASTPADSDTPTADEPSEPAKDESGNILKIKKTDVTPKGYPRTYDKIKKSLKKNSK